MRKLPLAPWQLATGAALFIALGNNVPLFSALFAAPEILSLAGLGFMLSLVLLMVLVLDIIILALGFGWLLKATIAVLLILSATFGYFSNELGIIFDPGMIANMLETVRDNNVAEARELASLPFIRHVLIFGITPALLLHFITLVPKPLLLDLGQRMLVVAGIAALFVAITLPNYRFVSFFAREHHDLQFSITPVYPLVSLARLVRKNLRSDQAFRIVDADATRHKTDKRRTIGIMVVGETARADHFSLDGYPRETNPLLASTPNVQFAHAHSCGTSTLFSVPCMFSIRDRKSYDVDEAAFESNVLDILRAAGVSPVWIDNNSSCKGVCARIESISLRENADASSPLYSDMGYYDEALIPEVDDYLGATGPDTLIVLHMLGSHGPAYSRRYPKTFERFRPSCDKTSPVECSVEEIANAYDNTILYTDFVLRRLIEKLQSHSGEFDSFLFYASDHGESLGEGGVYLHGLPYALAPESQTVVPFVFWTSPGFREARMHGVQLSHDNISHTLLGLYDVDAASYRRELDLFAG
ncbi:MAG TPA: phosphoethanolamine--lipid A transferase [Woeseiaceae bacterium]|nr:phosphoethanolamine--lipid A transferase [Woeseiaceae bacterium]